MNHGTHGLHGIIFIFFFRVFSVFRGYIVSSQYHRALLESVGCNKRSALHLFHAAQCSVAYMDVGEGREQDAEASFIAPYAMTAFTRSY
jgi:hypothetical protein